MEGNNLQSEATVPTGAVSAQGAPAPQATELMIPKRRFDEVTEKFNETEAKLAEALKEIEAYKGKDSKISELEKKIKDMEVSYALERSNAKKMSEIDKAIGDTSVDPEVVKKLLDMEKISFDEKEGLKGFTEQYDELKKNKAYLFKKAVPVAPKSAAGMEPTTKSFARTLAEDKVKASGIVAKAKNYFN